MSEGGGSFEDRLKAARTKRGLDAPAAGSEPYGNDTATAQSSALGIGLRVGVELVSALAVAVVIGWALDWWLHTTPILLGVFVLLGGAAGVVNVWRVVGPKPPGRGGS